MSWFRVCFEVTKVASKVPFATFLRPVKEIRNQTSNFVPIKSPAPNSIGSRVVCSVEEFGGPSEKQSDIGCLHLSYYCTVFVARRHLTDSSGIKDQSSMSDDVLNFMRCEVGRPAHMPPPSLSPSSKFIALLHTSSVINTVYCGNEICRESLSG